MKIYSIMIRDNRNVLIGIFHTAFVSLEAAESSAINFWMPYTQKTGRGIPHRVTVGEQISY